MTGWKRRIPWLALLLVACSRLTGLPEVPADVTRADAGLEDLARYTEEVRRLARAPQPETSPDAVGMAALARLAIARGERESGLRDLAAALEKDPGDLLLGNEYRMSVLRLKRIHLAESKSRGDRSPDLPAYLKDEPLATLTRIGGHEPSREIELQIALAHVDRMVLYPALEIKAPASIDSVHTFTKILDASPHYVPALFGRGLNYVYRPRNLVWPEHPGPPPDAASRDLSLAAAVGAKVGGASERVKGILLTTLGDACAHEGNVALARSWWALARETSDDPDVEAAIRLRMTWSDADAPDKLEEHFDERMEDQDHPASDLSFLWSDAARGPS